MQYPSVCMTILSESREIHLQNLNKMSWINSESLKKWDLSRITESRIVIPSQHYAKPKHIFRIAFEVRTQRFLSSSSPSNSTSTTMASSSALTKPKSEMTPEELEAKEQQEFNTGPLSVLTESVKGNTQVPILTSVLRFTMIIQLVKLTCHHIDV